MSRRLPDELTELTPSAEYPVTVSEALTDLAGKIESRLAAAPKRELGES